MCLIVICQYNIPLSFGSPPQKKKHIFALIVHMVHYLLLSLWYVPVQNCWFNSLSLDQYHFFNQFTFSLISVSYIAFRSKVTWYYNDRFVQLLTGVRVIYINLWMGFPPKYSIQKTWVLLNSFKWSFMCFNCHTVTTSWFDRQLIQFWPNHRMVENYLVRVKRFNIIYRWLIHYWPNHGWKLLGSCKKIQHH